uniref:Reverse transcriptase domain-containing protein n=1 Tax=Sinocyclocheilus rhinocerous TaxID=307959 RepID=A0A673KZ17_9TELE
MNCGQKVYVNCEKQCSIRSLASLYKITNDLLIVSDQGCISLLVLLDLSAAFDSIDQRFSIPVLEWFRSYLSDRYHFVCPLLLSIYMLPLGNIIRKYGISFHCYADDTQLYISTRPDETSKLYKLTECVKNTDILFIGPKNSTQNLLDYNLHLDGCTVTSSTVQNLGVILDSNLSFENHISDVTKTAFFHLRNIAKLRNMLPVSDAEKLVHAFMTSRLDYCNALLGGCPASAINKLQVVQNAAA